MNISCLTVYAILSLFPYSIFQSKSMFLPSWQHAKYKDQTNEYGISSLNWICMCMLSCFISNMNQFSVNLRIILYKMSLHLITLLMFDLGLGKYNNADLQKQLYFNLYNVYKKAGFFKKFNYHYLPCMESFESWMVPSLPPLPHPSKVAS